MSANGDGAPVFEVFVQSDPGAAFVHVGEVSSPDPDTALLAAKEHFARRDRTEAIWVVDRRDVHVSPWPPEVLAAGHRKVYRRSLGRGDADILPGRL